MSKRMHNNQFFNANSNNRSAQSNGRVPAYETRAQRKNRQKKRSSALLGGLVVLLLVAVGVVVYLVLKG